MGLGEAEGRVEREEGWVEWGGVMVEDRGIKGRGKEKKVKREISNKRKLEDDESRRVRTIEGR